MLEELRKKTLKYVVLQGLLLILVGGALLVANVVSAYFAITGYRDFEELAPEQIKSGMLVNAEIYQNYGCFIEEYEKNTKTGVTKTTDYYYVIYTGAYYDVDVDYKYMAIKVPATYGRRMEAMADDTYDGYLSDPLSFSGRIKRMNQKEQKYFNEFWEAVGFTEEDRKELTLPYYISTIDSVSGTNVAVISLSLVGLLLVVWGVFRIVKAGRGGYLKKFRQDFGSAGYAEPSIESDLRTAVSFGKKDNIKVGRLCTYVNLNTYVPRAIPNGQLSWVYQNTTTHRRNGITTGTTYSVMLYTEGEKNPFNISVPSEAIAQDVLKKILEMMPWVVVGYKDEWKSMYTKNRAEFLNLRYHMVEHTVIEPGFGDASDGYRMDESASCVEPEEAAEASVPEPEEAPDAGPEDDSAPQ